MIFSVRLNQFIFRLFVILSLAGCNAQIQATKEAKSGGAVSGSQGNFPGCVSVAADSTSSLEVTYAVPAGATAFTVRRDGRDVYTIRNFSTNSFIDRGLEEGVSYTYSCEAVINKKTLVGYTDVTGTTPAVTAPVFAGIATATALGPTSVKITWLPQTGGAVARTYRVYATMNGSTNFSVIRTTVNSGNYEATISNLADDMLYSFSVRACNASDICDSNTNEVQLTMPDKGAATTSGVFSVTQSNGKAQIYLPWEESNGAIKKRRVYRHTVNDVVEMLTSTYLISTTVIAAGDLDAPQTTIEDATVAEGETYYYIARDEDPSGNITLSTIVRSITVGDLTAPVFAGLTSVATGNPTETSVYLTFESTTHGTTGASHYLVYKSEADHPAVPADSCTSGTLAATIPATNFTASTVGQVYHLTGLTSRKIYSFCMKAKDAADNISNTVVTRTITMPDLTAPSFDNIQSLVYDEANSRFVMSWNTSASSDISYYKARIWKNTANPLVGNIVTKNFTHGANPTGGTFNTSDIAYADGNTLYAVVDACDNAQTAPGYNTVDNCTSFAINTAKIKTLADTTAPTPFSGVTTVTNISEGLMQVNWTLPADKSDFVSFKFYHVEETAAGIYSKQFLDQTSCIASDCVNNPKTTHFLAVNRFYHDYNIFVSAVDLAGNETNVLTAPELLSTFFISSLDTTPPSFSSNLSLTKVGGNLVVAWSAATDTQYTQKNYSTPNTITYEVYRKTGLTALNPVSYVNGVPDYVGDPLISRLVTAQAGTSYNDPIGALTQGQTYHYTVCARDKKGNVTCDQIKDYEVVDGVSPDVTPQVTESFNSSTWDLKLTLSDGPKDPTGIAVQVWRKFSDSPSDFPAASGGQFGSSKNGTGTIATPTQFTFASDALANDVAGTNHYANYTYKATDAAGNITNGNYSHVIRRPTGVGAVANEVIVAKSCGDEATCTFTITGVQSSLTDPAVGLASNTVLIEVLSNPTYGSLSACSQSGDNYSCNYTSTGYSGADSYTLRIKDSILNSVDYIKVNVTVVANSAPVAASNNHTYMPNAYTPYVFNILNGATDVDGDTLALTGTPNFNNLPTALRDSISCNLSAGTCTLTTANIWYWFGTFGSFSFTYTVTDGYLTTTQTSYIKAYSPFTWTGRGGNSNWSTPGNWCGASVSAAIDGVCVGAATAPTSSDITLFNNLCESNCTDVRINANAVADAVHLTSTFPGKITVDSGISFDFGGANISSNDTDGIFTIDTGKTFDALNALSGSRLKRVTNSGTLIAPSGTLYIGLSAGDAAGNGSDLGFSGFVHSNGKVIFDFNDTENDASNLLLVGPWAGSSSTTTFYDLEIKTGANDRNQIIRFYNNVVVAHDLTVTNGILQAQNTTPTYYSITVQGNLSVGYTDANNYGDMTSLPNVIMTGTNKTISTVQGVNAKTAGKITIDGGGSISSANADLLLGHLYVKNGSFTAPSGTLTIQQDWQPLTYRDYGDDALIRGLVVDPSGTFTHNSGTLYLLGTNAGSTSQYPEMVVKATSGITLNNMIVDMPGVNSTSVNGYRSYSKDHGQLVLTESTTLTVNGTLTLVNGNLHGGVVNLKGDLDAQCVNPAADSCFRGGTTEIQFNAPNIAQTISIQNSATSPVLVINNGQSYSLSGTDQGVAGLRITNGAFTAPAGEMRIGSDSAFKTKADDGWGVGYPYEHGSIFEVGGSGTFNHNSGTIRFAIGTKYVDNTWNSPLATISSGTFYDLIIDNFDSNTSGGGVGCLSITAGSTLTVLNDFTMSGECLVSTTGKIKVAGNVIFDLANNGEEPAILTAELELNGTGNQSISKATAVSIFDAYTSFTLGKLTINKSGNGYVELLSDFNLNVLEKFSTFTIGASDRFYTNNKGINYTTPAFTGSLVSNTVCPSTSTYGGGSPATDYVRVPKNTTYGTSADFCVMKYEAKCVGAGCTPSAGTAPSAATTAAISQAAGLPWVGIYNTHASTACSNLGARYGLISNAEWMTIAINAEAQAVNWTGGAVGSGILFRGNSDGSPGARVAVTNSLDPYSDTGESSADPSADDVAQNRTHTLSNGSVVWDLGANVFEPVDWDNNPASLTPKTGLAAATCLADQFDLVSCTGLAAVDYKPADPAGIGAGYDVDYGLGSFTGGDNIGYISRGGAYGYYWNAGIFRTGFNSYVGAYNSSNTGFRCVYRP